MKDRKKTSKAKVLRRREAIRKLASETKKKDRLIHRTRRRMAPIKKSEMIDLPQKQVDHSIALGNLAKLESMMKAIETEEENRKKWKEAKPTDEQLGMMPE